MANKREYFPYPVACLTVHELHLNSRNDYIWWHKRHKPKSLPRFPNRVYQTEWISWNEYLGNHNRFEKIQQKNYRPFWEAVKWAQQFSADHNLNTSADWIRLTRGKNILPDDIPVYPEQSYKEEWKGNGWGTWLGTGIRGKLIAAYQNVRLLAICVSSKLDIPTNLIEIIHAHAGEVELLEILARRSDLICKHLYKWDPSSGNKVLELFNMYGTEQDDRNRYMLRDYNSLVYELDNLLDWYVPRKKFT